MMRYDIQIDSELFKTYKDIRLGVMRFHADVEKTQEKFWKYMETDVTPQIQKEIEGKQWNDLPGVKGSRRAYKAFGRNPGRYRVSSEALLRRVRRGDDLYHINSVVDVNNLISVRSGLSVGSYDLNLIKGPIQLRQAKSGEGYTGIGKSFIDMENMLVLADEEGIFGSSMSDSTRTMVTQQTKDVLVVLYCFENDIDLMKLLEEGKQAFEKFAKVQDLEYWSVEK